MVSHPDDAAEMITIDGLLAPQSQPYPIVLMAGGEGRRLRPLTEHTPKRAPVLSAGGACRARRSLGLRRLRQSGIDRPCLNHCVCQQR